MIIVMPLSSSNSGFLKNALADGLAQETLYGTISHTRQISLLVQLNPSVITNVTKNRSIQFELKDLTRNSTIVPHTTFDISITRVNNGPTKGELSILHDRFHSHNGLLVLQSQQSNSNQNESTPIAVVGNKEPSLNAWLGDSSGTIYLRGPFLAESGLYHIHAEILGIDNDTLSLEPPQKFDSFLSLGGTFSSKFLYNNQVVNITIISYYDKVKNYDYVPENKTISWSTPFYWNLTQINIGNVLVHQEIKIPKSFINSTNMTSFSGTVNGKVLNSAAILIDPYSSVTDTTIHYVIHKDTLLNLAESNNLLNGSSHNSSDLSFSLLLDKPLKMVKFFDSGAVTNTRHAIVFVDYTPSQLVPDPNTNLAFVFYAYDGVKEVPLSRDVYYDFKIFDKNGVNLLTMNNLTATNGEDIRILPFSAQDTIKVFVNIKGVKQGSDLDKEYNGLATVLVSVPEFPPSSSQETLFFLISGLFVAAIVSKKLGSYSSRSWKS